MEFVFSFWYIVMAILVVGIVAALFVFFKMDKKDKVLIDEFIKNASKPAEKTEEVKAEEVKTEEKAE